MAITFDQFLGSAHAGTGGTVAITTGATAAAGSRIVVVWSWFDTVTRTPSCSDGTAYTNDKQINNGSDRIVIFSRVLAGSLASGSTITLSSGGGNSGGLAIACSYLGTTAVDTTSNNSTTGTSFSSGAAANSVADALFIGGAGNETATTSVGGTNTNGTLRNAAADIWDATAQQGARMLDVIASSIGSQALTGTWGVTSSATTGALVIYKGTAAAPVIPPATYARTVLSRGVRQLSEIVRFQRRRPLVIFTISGTTFSDSMAGSILISGSRTESRVGSNTRTGSILISGSRTESRVGSNTRTGSILISGSRVESRVGSNSITGSILISGTKNETRTGANSRTGSIQISGSRSESRVISNTRTGTVQINGTGSDPPPNAGAAHQDFAIRLHGRLTHESSPPS